MFPPAEKGQSTLSFKKLLSKGVPSSCCAVGSGLDGGSWGTFGELISWGFLATTLIIIFEHLVLPKVSLAAVTRLSFLDPLCSLPRSIRQIFLAYCTFLRDMRGHKAAVFRGEDNVRALYNIIKIMGYWYHDWYHVVPLLHPGCRLLDLQARNELPSLRDVFTWAKQVPCEALRSTL